MGRKCRVAGLEWTLEGSMGDIEAERAAIDTELRSMFEEMTPEQYEEFKRRFISEMLLRSGAVRSMFPRNTTALKFPVRVTNAKE